MRQERGWRLRARLAGIAEDPEIRQTCRVSAARETETELQAAARAIFLRLTVEILRQVLADVGLEAGVCVENNDCVDALLALPQKRLRGRTIEFFSPTFYHFSPTPPNFSPNPL